MKTKFKNLSIVLLILTICFSILSGCGAKKSETSISSAEETVQNQSAADSSGFGSNKNEQKPIEKQKQVKENELDRKIIKSATMEIETLEFDRAISEITAKVQSIKGYIESSNIQGRRIEQKDQIQNRFASIILRVPKQNFDTFILEIGSLGNVLNKNTTGQDVTSEYFDTEAHLKSLMIQEERLLEILKKTGQLKDIIELERELSDVRYQIENLTGTLKKWDNLIDYSTIRLDLREVQEVQLAKEKPRTFWNQVIYGFNESIEFLIKTFKYLIVLIASALPFILIGFILYIILKRILKLNINFFKKIKIKINYKPSRRKL
jgi:hypothetical protein